ncbi:MULTISPECIES: polysaccharide pyruvyl transferase family protein [Streptomyces]|uniref:Polysaccharide pyruvyl transferase n=1 Tax=Streptomyces fradiae TaxID=1906 RepID=A0ACC4W630_STRFR|nr:MULTISPECIES: polysaccharide pyruvyl transferase family protein [Streptomyces]KNE80104.1 polysaccharide pyruvyl transferase [Streptomyces fradiae]OFA47359.1 polysaccharide pyruvyl transferase [Streptomyces fradiae]PQM21782.1 polysaccharide pyruvyl transferase [Streptomyces xinghaiensis]
MSTPTDGPDAAPRGGRVLLTGWFSFLHGEATVGDLLALDRVRAVLDRRGTAYDTAWSGGFHPRGLRLDAADPGRYRAVVFICGPLHGPQIEDLHRRFPHCLRIAVGVSVLDAADPAVRGFHRVLARDAPGVPPSLRDLAVSAPRSPAPPVVGVALTRGQGEYGGRRRHEAAGDTLTGWLNGKDCARLDVETRLDPGDWRLAATAAQFEAVVARLDVLVTNRLHGLVTGLRAGVPVLAVDAVAGGAKLTAQAQACDWPALVPVEKADTAGLDRWWAWCLDEGRALARQRSEEFHAAPETALLTGLTAALDGAAR